MTETTNNQPATKGNLADLRTVLTTDITNLRTELKTDINRMDQKIGQLDKTVRSIAIELTKTQADVREIKHDMATKMSTKDDISRVLNAVDALTAEVVSYRNHDAL